MDRLETEITIGSKEGDRIMKRWEGKKDGVCFGQREVNVRYATKRYQKVKQ